MLALLLLTALATPPAVSPAPLEALAPSLATLVAASPLDSLVAMMKKELGADVRLRLPEGIERGGSTRSATAILLDREGFAVTTACFVTQGWPMRARLSDGAEVDVLPVGVDLESDLAVVRLVGESTFTPAPWATSLAIQPGATLGILGAGPDTRCVWGEGQLEQMRLNPAAGLLHDYLKLGGAFQPHSAGSAVLDARGGVIGMVSARAGGGKTLAVPAPTVLLVASEIKKRGALTRGWLGVTTVSRSRAGPPERGVRVTGVVAGSPAEAAGIRPGDVILGFGGRPVLDLGDFVARVGASRPGARVTLAFLRDGQEGQAEATLFARPSSPGSPGLVVRLAEERPYLGVTTAAAGARGGLVVTAVEPGGPADSAGLKPGDRLRHLAGEPLADAGELRARIAAFEPGDRAEIEVVRGSSPLVLLATIGRRTQETRLSDLPRFQVAYDAREWESFRALVRSLPAEGQQEGAIAISRFLRLNSVSLSARARRQIEELKQEVLRSRLAPTAVPADER